MSNIDTTSRTKKQDSELHSGVASGGTLGGRGQLAPSFGPKRGKVSVRRSKEQILLEEQNTLASSSKWWNEYRVHGPRARLPSRPDLPTTRSTSAPGHPAPSKASAPAKKTKKRPREPEGESASRRPRHQGPAGGTSSSASAQPPAAPTPTTEDFSVSLTESEAFAQSVLEKSEVVPSGVSSLSTRPQVGYLEETAPEKQKGQLSSWPTSSGLAPVQAPAPDGGRVAPTGWRSEQGLLSESEDSDAESVSSEPTPEKSPLKQLLPERGGLSDAEDDFKDAESGPSDPRNDSRDTGSDSREDENNSGENQSEGSHHSSEENNNSSEESDGGSRRSSKSDMNIKPEEKGSGGGGSGNGGRPTRYFIDDQVPKWTLEPQTAENYNTRTREGYFLAHNQTANQGDAELWSSEQRWEFFQNTDFQPFRGQRARDGKESSVKYQLLLNNCKLANTEDDSASYEEGEGNRFTLTTVYLAVFVSDTEADRITIQQVKRDHTTFYKQIQDQAATAQSILDDFREFGRNDKIIRDAKERLYDYTKTLYMLDKTKTTIWNLSMRPSSQICIRDHHAAMTLYHDSMIDALKSLLHNNDIDYSKFLYDPKYTGAATEKTPDSKDGSKNFLGKIKVPDIALPKWDGKPVSWSKYWFIFSDLYHNNGDAPIAMKLAALENSLPDAEKKRLHTYQYNLDGYSSYIKDLRRRNESIEYEVRLAHKAKIQTLFVCNTGSAGELPVGVIYTRLRAFQDKILEAKRGYEYTGNFKKCESVEWYPPLERKLTGVERERWLSYRYLLKERNTWNDKDEFTHFIEWIEERVEDLRSEYERGSVQQTIENSYKKGSAPSGNKTKVVTKEFNTHATSFTRKPPPKRKSEFKMEIPQRCPWMLNSGRRCNQPHAPASCDPSGWAPGEVWRTVYAEQLCPVCLCTGHRSAGCPNRNKGPCNRTVKGGKMCTYYHHSKLCKFPFISLSQWRDGNAQRHKNGGQGQAVKPKQQSGGTSTSVHATSSRQNTGSSRATGRSKKKGGQPKKKEKDRQ